MPSKNDISGLLKQKKTQPTILPANEGQGVTKPARAPLTGTPVKATGRPPKAKEEKRSEKITLSLTKAEKAKIAEQAGLAGEATFLYAKLKETGIFG